MNDVLTVFKADWDIVEDRRVQNELGVLVSKANNWVITDPQIVMALQYGNPNYPPYSIGNEYVSVSEKNEVADSWVNRTAEAWYKSASGGHLSFQQPSFFQRVSPVWIVMIAVAVVFVIVYGVAPFCRGAKGGGKAVRESQPAGAVRTVALQLPGDSRTQRDGCS